MWATPESGTIENQVGTKEWSDDSTTRERRNVFAKRHATHEMEGFDELSGDFAVPALGRTIPWNEG